LILLDTDIVTLLDQKKEKVASTDANASQGRRDVCAAAVCYYEGVGGWIVMKAVELNGDIDEQHRLRAEVPADFPVGPVRVIVLLPEEDEAGMAWTQGVGKEWADELGDSRQDIYTLQDGQPIDAPR
jgi:hypothetical protein